MAEFAKCANGHEWEIPPNQESDSKSTLLICPVCGCTISEETIRHEAPSGISDSKTESSFSLDDPLGSKPPAEVPFFNDPPRYLPGYEILGTLGRGGMGVVYKAHQKALNRVVALKMIHAHEASSPVGLARFQSEAQAVAQLQHPNIVQIYETGDFGGNPYFSLEMVTGGTLAQKLKKNSFSPRQAAQLMETLARTIHCAHEKGIIHRDLKPGNILLTESGVPKITDFGLAKNLLETTRESLKTRTGEVLGTPTYMSPEQAHGAGTKIGPASDIYSLGAILYELLTGRPPIQGTNFLQTILQVIEEEPVAPRTIQPKIPRDLNTICLTCLQKDPFRRYASAANLAADLRAFLAGEPIKARPPTRWERIHRWIRKQPTLAILAAFSLLGLVGVTTGLLWHNTLTVIAIALVGILAVSWWYQVQMQKNLLERKEQHLHAERNIERLHLLLETTQKILQTTNQEELLLLLSETTTRLLNAERATVYLIDDEKEELWSKVALGENMGEIRVSLGSGIAGTVALSGEIINLDDPHKDSRFNPEIDRRTGYKTRNLLTLPIREEDQQIVGVFQILNKREGNFEKGDIEILHTLANCTAIVVGKSHNSHGPEKISNP